MLLTHAASGRVAHTQGLAQLRQRRKMRRNGSSAGGVLGAGTNEVQLEWRDLTCTLTDKKTG